MTTLIVIMLLSFGLCLILTPIARAWAIRQGLVDRPDGRRKMQPQAIPLAGGLAILVSCSGAVLVAVLLAPHPLRDRLWEQGSSLLGLLLAAVVICAVGLADDCRGLRGRHKLLGQLVAAGIVMGSGVWVQNIRLFGWQLDLGLLALPFTLFWLLGAINSLNLIDGMDGLLSCVGLIISLAIAVMAVLAYQWAAACVAVALAGALLGFLRYNFPPATIFLGDSGSMLIGLVVGVLAIQSSLKGPATIALAAPLAVFAIPILDTGAAIVRRKLTGRSVYTTDRGHLHHCLLRRGFSNRHVLLCICCLCFLTVLGMLASQAFNNELLAIVSTLAVIGILIVSRLFGYAEVLLLKEHILATAASFWQVPGGPNNRQIEARLQGSANWKDLWTTLTACAEELKLKRVRLNVHAPAIQECYFAQWGSFEEEAEHPNLWHAEIPVGFRQQSVGRLEITGQRDDAPVWEKILTIARCLEDFENSAVTPTANAYSTPQGESASPRAVLQAERIPS